MLLLSISACEVKPASSVRGPTTGESTPSTQESTNNETTPVTQAPIKTDTETRTYIVGSSLPKYNIKITYASNKKETVLCLSLLEENNANEIQSVSLSDNYRFTREPIYITDITFDGYADILVPYQRSASAQYFMAFVWDSETNTLIYAPEFQNLSNVALDKERKLILSSRSADKISSYSLSVFDKNLNNFKVCKSLYYYPEGEHVIYKEQQLENGIMHTILELKVPYAQQDFYSMNPSLKKYYDDNTDWNINSSKWEIYIIPVSETSAY